MSSGIPQMGQFPKVDLDALEDFDFDADCDAKLKAAFAETENQDREKTIMSNAAAIKPFVPAQQSVQPIELPKTVEYRPLDGSMEMIRGLQEYMRDNLVKDTDYGLIPGCGNKPKLFKSGSEKLMVLYQLRPSFSVEHREFDQDTGFVLYEIKCTLTRGGEFIAEGVGAANSNETRFMRDSVPDGHNLANNILKTAKKRAQVDAVLTATCSSSLFVQGTAYTKPRYTPANAEPASQQPAQVSDGSPPQAQQSAPTQMANPNEPSEKQINYLLKLIGDHREHPNVGFYASLTYETARELGRQKVSQLIEMVLKAAKQG